MNKAQEVLEGSEIHTWEDKVVFDQKDVLSAMEQQAIAFHNWLTNSEWEKVEGDYDTYWNGKAGEEMKVENTKSLYQIFNYPTNGE